MTSNCIVDKVIGCAGCIFNGVCYVIENHLVVVASIAFVIGSTRYYQNYQKKQRRNKWASAGKDVAVLHCFPRTKVTPNISPFGMKLETYLRMANIKYELDDVEFFGPKGKCPWITFNGKEYADSELIIDFLRKKLSQDLNSHLSIEERSISRFISITLCEHIFWSIDYYFTITSASTLLSIMKLPFFIRITLPLLKRHIKKNLKAQGIGLHSDSEIREIMRKSFEALSNYLGNKPFFMGSQPSEVDCSAFGFLSQFVYAQPDSPFEVMVKETYPNLHKYCERMKEKYYPDWNELLSK